MRKLIKIYGERHTGTNYLGKLIDHNLDAKQLPGVVPAYILKLQKMLPGQELLRDSYFAMTFKYNLGWKHTRAKSVGEFTTRDTEKRNICFITLTKNPYSWLLSLYRRPYHQLHGESPDFETFLRMPWKTSARENCEKVLNSPVELWNLKNASYLQLAKISALNLTIEGLLKAPGSIIEQISVHFSINRLSDQFVNYEQSTKDKSKSFAYYQNYYLNEKWRKNLSAEAISIINRHVDRNLMRQFGYMGIP